FADVLLVKDHDFALGDPLHADPLPPPAPSRFDVKNNQFVFKDPGGNAATQVILSRRGRVDGSRIDFAIELPPRARWGLRVDVVASSDGRVVVPRVVERRFGAERERVRESLTSWRLRVPHLHAAWD